MRALVSLASVLTAFAVACSPAPATAPAKPTAVQAAAGWDGVVAAAKQEGKLVLSTHAGSSYEKYVELVKQGSRT